VGARDPGNVEMSAPKRGDLYWIHLDPTIGAEIKKTRPCVVISPDAANRSGPLVIVAPVTTVRGNKIYFHEVPIPKGPSNLSRASKIKVFQLRCVDKKRLSKEKIGTLPKEIIDRLDEKLRIVTGLY